MTVITLVGVLADPLWSAVFKPGDPGDAALGLVSAAVLLAGYARLLWSNLMRRITDAHRFGLALLTVLCAALPMMLGLAWINALVVPSGLIAVVLPLRRA